MWDFWGECGILGEALRGMRKLSVCKRARSCVKLQCRHLQSIPPRTTKEITREVPSGVEQGLETNALVDKIKQCGERKELEGGKHLHSHAITAGFHNNRYVAHALITMYGKCRSMRDALDVFHNMNQRDVVSWNTLMLGYVENGESSMALNVFHRLDCTPNRVTFVAALKACAGLATEKQSDKKACLHKGMAIHRQARERGFLKDVVVVNILVDMYSKCGSMREAQEVFERMLHRTVVSWTALILGYVENGESLVALNVFSNMDCVPNHITFVAALKACTCLACLEKGRRIHKQVKESGYENDVYVGNALVNMYSKCGSMQDAQDVFDRMSRRTTVSWNSLMLGYVGNGESLMALDVFARMDRAPDEISFVAALKACASVGALEIGQRLHERIREHGYEQDRIVSTCLLDFYGRCGNMAAAEEVFNKMHSRDIVSWTALIGGYTSVGDAHQVFSVVKRMQEDGVRMDDITMLSVLKACSHAGLVEEAERYFESMCKYDIHPTVEHYTCMVDMLGRANRLQEALSLVNRMPYEANGYTWMSLLGACGKWGNVEVAKFAFDELVSRNMDEDALAPAYVLMGSIYKRQGMLQEGERIEAKTKNLK